MLTMICLAGTIILVAFVLKTMEDVKVNGPIYAKILQGEYLLADIFPPPEYIIESYLVAMSMLHEDNPDKIKG